MFTWKYANAPPSRPPRPLSAESAWSHGQQTHLAFRLDPTLSLTSRVFPSTSCLTTPVAALSPSTTLTARSGVSPEVTASVRGNVSATPIERQLDLAGTFHPSRLWAFFRTSNLFRPSGISRIHLPTQPQGRTPLKASRQRPRQSWWLTWRSHTGPASPPCSLSTPMCSLLTNTTWVGQISSPMRSTSNHRSRFGGLTSAWRRNTSAWSRNRPKCGSK